MMMKLKGLLTTGAATAIALGLMTGFAYGQGQSNESEENPDDGPPPVEREQPGQISGDEGDVSTDPRERNMQSNRAGDNGARDSLADQLVRDQPDMEEIQKHLEEALIASGVGSEEAAEKSEELARTITDALAESNTEANEFGVGNESDGNRGSERGTQRGTERGSERGSERDAEEGEEDEEDNNGGLW